MLTFAQDGISRAAALELDVSAFVRPAKGFHSALEVLEASRRFGFVDGGELPVRNAPLAQREYINPAFRRLLREVTNRDFEASAVITLEHDGATFDAIDRDDQ